jgi:hypothetical protein
LVAGWGSFIAFGGLGRCTLFMGVSLSCVPLLPAKKVTITDAVGFCFFALFLWRFLVKCGVFCCSLSGFFAFSGFYYFMGFILFSFLVFNFIVLVVLLEFWPFLVFLVVYWRRPCAGQHLLSLPPQRK